LFTIIIRGVKVEGDTVTLTSENRNAARNVQIVCIENKLVCEVTQEVAPRPVRFKGVEPYAELASYEQARVDAEVDSKAKAEYVAQCDVEADKTYAQGD